MKPYIVSTLQTTPKNISRPSVWLEKEKMDLEYYVRRGGVLPAIMTSLAFPERRVFRVLLYPKVTTSNVVSVIALFEQVVGRLMIDEA